jgi:integrase
MLGRDGGDASIADVLLVAVPGTAIADADGEPVHPHAISQAFERIARRSGSPVIRLYDVRHTNGTLLIKAGGPVKVVSARPGHATPSLTIDSYQHVLPGMQAEAARTFESLVAPALLPGTTSTAITG